MAMGGKLMAIKTSASKGDGKGDVEARKKCLATLYKRLQRLEKTQGGYKNVLHKKQGN